MARLYSWPTDYQDCLTHFSAVSRTHPLSLSISKRLTNVSESSESKWFRHSKTRTWPPLVSSLSPLMVLRAAVLVLTAVVHSSDAIRITRREIYSLGSCSNKSSRGLRAVRAVQELRRWQIQLLPLRFAGLLFVVTSRTDFVSSAGGLLRWRKLWRRGILLSKLCHFPHCRSVVSP